MYTIREFSISDYEDAIRLWGATEGLALDDADSESSIEAFLARNPGFSAVAIAADGELVGAVLCGHNGRAASLYHLAVAERCRGAGVGSMMVSFCIERLVAAGVSRCNVHVYRDNSSGIRFWESNDWRIPPDWMIMQRKTGG